MKPKYAGNTISLSKILNQKKMNPSATGWIKKLIKVLNPSQTLANTSIDNYYEAFRNCGFIYGSNVEIVAKLIENKDFETEEICKKNNFITIDFISNKSNYLYKTYE